MLRRMTSKFPGKCRQCKAPIAVGQVIYWSKPTGALCEACGSKQEAPKDQTRSDFKPQSTQTRAPEDRRDYFTIDYSELKTVVSEALEGRSVVKRAKNQSLIQDHTTGAHMGFHGYTAETLKRWIAEGYEAPGITNLPDFTPPIREKRRYKFNDDDGEMHIDRALSGEDNYFGDWTKQERIPGVAIEAEIMFAARVPAEIVNAYNVWVCRAVKALEMSGIDCQVSFRFSTEDANPNTAWSHAVVRVKKENETADFRSFTPILSPAALRTFGFVAIILHAEREKATAYGSLGHGRYNAKPAPEWAVRYDSDRRVIVFDCPYIPNSFPEEHMTEQFRKAVREMKNATS